MTEILIFTLNAIFIYLFSDWIIRVIEEKRGKVLKQRQVVFFVVFLILALLSFQILRSIFGAN
jgi:surface polysaccharide O-acyltransferase-like enzyme